MARAGPGGGPAGECPGPPMFEVFSHRFGGHRCVKVLYLPIEADGRHRLEFTATGLGEDLSLRWGFPGPGGRWASEREEAFARAGRALAPLPVDLAHGDAGRELEFVLRAAGDQWLKDGDRNFRFRLPPRWHVGGFVLAAVPRLEEACCAVHFLASTTQDLALHYGLVGESAAWKDAEFARLREGGTKELLVQLGTAGAGGRLGFVLRAGDRWLKNGHSDFEVQIPARPDRPHQGGPAPARPARLPRASSDVHPDLIEPRAHRVAFADPREKTRSAGVVAFYFAGRPSEWDSLCGSGFLGNFWELGADGLSVAARDPPERRPFANAEAAFQALKFWGLADQFRHASGAEAFRLKKQLRGNEDWSYGGYGSNWLAMLAVLRAKFSAANAQTSACRAALLRTGDAYLLEHNAEPGRDAIWSDNHTGDGTNWLGLQLMLLRDELQGNRAGPGAWTQYITRYCGIDLETGSPSGPAGKSAWKATVRSATSALVSALRTPP